ncbi:MAG: DinB family protein [candidate division NC10 bacterium]|nr:DinB family protein [candidate division NC10 bacterium]
MEGAGLSESTRLRLAIQLESLQVILGGVDPAAVNRRPASGKWSAHENLAHLARIHQLYLERIRRILSEERPELPRYKAEDDPEWPQWAALPTEEVLQRLQTLRGQLLELVGKLSAAQIGRPGIHPSVGAMTIPEWIEFFLLHEAHHLYAAMQRARGG